MEAREVGVGEVSELLFLLNSDIYILLMCSEAGKQPPRLIAEVYLLIRRGYLENACFLSIFLGIMFFSAVWSLFTTFLHKCFWLYLQAKN